MADFIHTEQIVDRVIDVLEGYGASRIGGLPAAWFDGTGGEERLQFVDHGDWSDYPSMESLMAQCPMIYVRGTGVTPVDSQFSGRNYETVESVRIVHVRGREHCRKAGGAREDNMTRARGRYAKEIAKALFSDPNRKLALLKSTDRAEQVQAEFREELALTCATGTALVTHVEFVGADLGGDYGQRGSSDDVRAIREHVHEVWAISFDIDVHVRSGSVGGN